MGILLLFPYFFFVKDANDLLPEDLRGSWLPAQGAAVNTPPEPTPTRSLHQDTQHPGWQGLRTCTGHPGGEARRVIYHVTDKDNPDGGVLQQPTGIRRDEIYRATILHRWSTGRQGVGIARPDQRWGSESTRFHGLNVLSCEIVLNIPDMEAG